MQWFKWLRRIDIAFGAASLVYGLCSVSLLWCAGGLLGLTVALFNPAQRLSIWLLGIKKRRS